MTINSPSPTHYREALQAALEAVELARRFYFFESIASTSDFARDLIARAGGARAAGDLHGTVVVADHQSAGRGRFQRAWLAPPGTALLFTLILDRGQVPAPPLLTLALPVATAVAITRHTGLAARIKFPNDILVHERKTAGILLEQPPGAGVVLAGIGVNVHQTADQLPPPTHVPPTSLEMELPRVSEKPETSHDNADDPSHDANTSASATSSLGPQRPALLAEILCRLSALIATPDPAAELPRRMNQLCDTLGRHVEVTTPDGILRGVALSITSDGALMVRTDAGMQRPIYSGDIKQLTAHSDK